MGRELHLYYGSASGTGYMAWYTSETGDVAREAANGQRTERVMSVLQFKQILEECKNNNNQLDLLAIYTHGGPACISFGRDDLTLPNLWEVFIGQGLETIFSAGATIRLIGCNIAQHAIGELFVASIGEIFLRGGGGTVEGENSVVRVLNDTTFNLMGQKIIARVYSGGGVSLTNAECLRPDLVRNYLSDYRRHISNYARTYDISNASLAPFMRRLESISMTIGPNSSQPRYMDVYVAHNELMSVVRNCNRILLAAAQVRAGRATSALAAQLSRPSWLRQSEAGIFPPGSRLRITYNGLSSHR